MKQTKVTVVSTEGDTATIKIEAPGENPKEETMVKVEGKEVRLTAKEFDLLFLFASHPGRVYSREQLLENVWGYTHYASARTVDTHIRRLRSKLGEFAALIETIRGVGYAFSDAHLPENTG